ncbi:hypothetical protein K1719_017767 [Acacia pycnantha]|nr:hypothetical protein K1719_017767 [Acacia pycnantha]
MGDTDTLEYPISEQTLQLLFGASNSNDLEKSLEKLIEVSKSSNGRSELASRRLLRNLCAREIANQNLLIELKRAAGDNLRKTIAKIFRDITKVKKLLDVCLSLCFVCTMQHQQ